MYKYTYKCLSHSRWYAGCKNVFVFQKEPDWVGAKAVEGSLPFIKSRNQ